MLKNFARVKIISRFSLPSKIGVPAAILCKGLDGRTSQEILELPGDFVTRIVGAELVRVRSQTIYYVLTRIKGICKVYLDRQRMAVA